MKWRWSREEAEKPFSTSWIKYFATWCIATCWSLSDYLPTFHCTSKAMVHDVTFTADIHSLTHVDRYMTCARFIRDSKCVADWNICMSFTSCVYIDSSSELRSIGHCIDALLCEVFVRPSITSHPMVELFSSCMNSSDWVNTLSSWEKVITFEIFTLHCKIVNLFRFDYNHQNWVGNLRRPKSDARTICTYNFNYT